MISSILESVKKNLGIPEDIHDFDPDIVMHINSAFNILYQLGVGPKDTSFMIEDGSSVWSDFYDNKNTNMIRSYIYARVRLLFDPPQMSSVMQQLKDDVKELEQRLMYECDHWDEELIRNEVMGIG